MYEFEHINNARSFLVNKLSSPQVLESTKDYTGFSKFIAPYPPQQQKEAALVAQGIVDDLSTSGVVAVVVNVYDAALEILVNEGIWDSVKEAELQYDKEFFAQALSDAISLENSLLPLIYSKASEEHTGKGKTQILILTGIGACYPWLRAHQLLQLINTDYPVLLFFPGKQNVLPDGSKSFDILSSPKGSGGSLYQARNIFDL